MPRPASKDSRLTGRRSFPAATAVMRGRPASCATRTGPGVQRSAQGLAWRRRAPARWRRARCGTRHREAREQPRPVNLLSLPGRPGHFGLIGLMIATLLARPGTDGVLRDHRPAVRLISFLLVSYVIYAFVLQPITGLRRADFVVVLGAGLNDGEPGSRRCWRAGWNGPAGVQTLAGAARPARADLSGGRAATSVSPRRRRWPAT